MYDKTIWYFFWTVQGTHRWGTISLGLYAGSNSFAEVCQLHYRQACLSENESSFRFWPFSGWLTAWGWQANVASVTYICGTLMLYTSTCDHIASHIQSSTMAHRPTFLDRTGLHSLCQYSHRQATSKAGEFHPYRAYPGILCHCTSARLFQPAPERCGGIQTLPEWGSAADAGFIIHGWDGWHSFSVPRWVDWLLRWDPQL